MYKIEQRKKTVIKEKGLLSKLSEDCGQLMIPYSLIRELNPLDCIVLARIICEYGYAKKNKCLINGGYFLYDPNELADNLNKTVEAISSTIKFLEEKDFITTSTVRNQSLIQINEEILLSYFSKSNRKWDENLDDIQQRGLFELQGIEGLPARKVVKKEEFSVLYDESGNIRQF